MRVGFRTLLCLAWCAAAAAAAMAHFAIDIVGDYALRHDTYDDVAHGSRELVSGLALLLAGVLAARGLRICCEIAAANRTRIPSRAPAHGERIRFMLGVVGSSAIVVPAMELLDGRLGDVPVKDLDDAFGGSILLGLGTTILCAIVVGMVVYGIVRWLISHRDAIVTVIETLLRRRSGAVRLRGHDLVRQLFTPRRRRAPHALSLCKRGPPRGGLYQRHHTRTSTEGDSREFRLRSRAAGAHRARGNAQLCRTG